MPRIKADFHFAVEALAVEAELLGVDATIVRNGYDVHLTIPAADDDFSYGRSDAPMEFGGDTQRADGEFINRSVLLLRATVELDAPLGGGPLSDVPNDVREANQAALALAADAARLVVREYIEHVRVRFGQYWLGRSGHQPRLTWRTELRDVVTGERVRTTYRDPLIAFPIIEVGMGRAEHGQVVEAIASQASPALHESLFADAKYLAWAASPAQPREAVLLAAIACEVAIRESLRNICPPVARSILEFALANPRDVSVQAASLYDKAAHAVAGVSLRKEDPATYKELEKLFADRNRVAHKGETPSSEEVAADLRGAERALRWASNLCVGSSA